MFASLRAKLRERRARRLTRAAARAVDARRIDEGWRLAHAAIAADPDLAAAHYVMARLHELAVRLDEAESSYRRAIALDPRHARAHNNLGGVLSLQGRIEEALACYRQALMIDPGQPEANQNLALLTRDAGAHESALQACQRTVAAEPLNSRAHARLGDLYRALARADEAMESLDRALELDPDNVEAHYSRAMLRLQRGDYAAGWQEYAWRWKLDNPFSAPARRFAMPIWDGSDLAGGSVLLHGESALGELVQFARYAPLVARRCGAVIFECAPRQQVLLRGIEGVSRVLAPGDALPPLAAHAPLFSLPAIFGTTLETIPWTGPYLRADEGRLAQWRPVVDAAAAGRLKVGLAWSGSAQNPHNRERSIDPALFAPLAKVPGVAFFGLQPGAGPASVPASLPLVDLAARERDLLDTVAFIGLLDLVITIDTGTAHLAGAAGARSWVLLNRTPDWRFHFDRADNPWYPTMRLFRQSRESDWTDVIAQVGAALQALAAAR